MSLCVYRIRRACRALRMMGWPWRGRCCCCCSFVRGYGIRRPVFCIQVRMPTGLGVNDTTEQVLLLSLHLIVAKLAIGSCWRNGKTVMACIAFGQMFSLLFLSLFDSIKRRFKKFSSNTYQNNYVRIIIELLDIYQI